MEKKKNDQRKGRLRTIGGQRYSLPVTVRSTVPNISYIGGQQYWVTSGCRVILDWHGYCNLHCTGYR